MILKPMKYKTVEDVFTHNFEALKPWGEFLCLPQRMPAAVRYFIAQQLSGAEARANLYPDEPLTATATVLTFEDDSIICLPDLLFGDRRSYRDYMVELRLRKKLLLLNREIDKLTRQTCVQEVEKRACAALFRFSLLECYPSVAVEKEVAILRWKLNRTVVGAFLWGRCRVADARELGVVVKCLGNLLALFPPCGEENLKVAIAQWLTRQILKGLHDIAMRQPGRRKSQFGARRPTD